jgi:hypothetical protein
MWRHTYSVGPLKKELKTSITGPLAEAGSLRDPTEYVSSPSPEDGNKSSFGNVLSTS